MSGFGERLRELRLRAGLTIEGLAEASGVSVRAISDTERGRSRAPQPRTVTALAAALGLGPTESDAFRTLARSGREDDAPIGRPRACDLPRRSGHFVGRAAELATIGRHVTELTPTGPALVAVLHGPPGVGKTALAIRAAEQQRALFPDGVFYLDFRGVEARPVTAGEAMAVLLKALGLSSRQIAAADDERAGQLRTILRERRCLVVLDNVGAESQVRSLLPGTGASAVLVTSRRALGGLEAVRRWSTAPLDPGESAALLRVAAGDDGAPQEIDTIARLCGHLPLALTIAGTRLASRPGWSTAALVEQLSDADRRLATLSVPGTGVQTAFAVSYSQLGTMEKTVFRRLAAVSTVSFTVVAGAVLAQCTPAEAEDRMEDLLELGLLQPEGDDRYRFHDLIRLFAADRLRAEESAAARAALEQRLVGWYLDSAIAAGRWFEPAYGTAPADWPYPNPLDTPERAQAWLQAEFDGWLDAMRRAAAAGEHQRVVDVAESLHWYSDRTYGTEPWGLVFGLSRDCAGRLPDRRQEITHTSYLAWALSACEMRFEESAAVALGAHRLAVQLGDLKEQADALRYAGQSLSLAGRNEEALDLLRQSLALTGKIDDHDTYVQTLVGIGMTLGRLGQFDAAAEQFRQALAEVDRRPLAPAPAQIARLTAWMNLSLAYVEGKLWHQALEATQVALPLAEEFGEPHLLGRVHFAAGQAYAALGRTGRAREDLTSAVRLLRTSRNRERLARAEAALAELAAGPA